MTPPLTLHVILQEVCGETVVSAVHADPTRIDAVEEWLKVAPNIGGERKWVRKVYVLVANDNG
jgi:hypothetical protein